jgi:hypothetical protein
MAQQRFINFGDFVLADKVNAISTAIVASGVLEGGAFTLFDTSTLSVGANKVMLPTLLLIEDAATQIAIDLTSDAKDYTIAYEHTNQNVQGGAPAQMVKLDGLFGFDALTDTVVLGWVQYPGGSIPLNISMFTEAPKLQITNPTSFESDVLLPPYLDKVHVQLETPTSGAITQTDIYSTTQTQAYLELENSDPAINTIVHYFPFISKLSPPERLLLEANSELGTSVTTTLVAEDGTEFQAENNTITNTSGSFELREMQVTSPDRSLFLLNRPYFVSVSSQLNPGKKVQISLIGTNINFLPF